MSGATPATPTPWTPPTADAWAAAGAATSPVPPLPHQDAAHATALAGAASIISALAARGHLSLVAGGWVRDALMGRPSADVDVATSAPPAAVTAAFERVVPMPNDTLIVSTPDHGAFEVAPFRGGGAEGEAASPPADPPAALIAAAARDAALRDFTVNALFYDPASGLVVDFVGGVADIAARMLRGCGADPAARLREDPLRCVRAVRLGAALGLAIHPATAAAVTVVAPACVPPAVAVERVWKEVVKLSGAEDSDAARAGAFADGLATARRLGLLPVILPELCGEGVDAAAADAILRRLGPGIPAALRLAAALPANFDFGGAASAAPSAASSSAASSSFTASGPPPPGSGAAALATRLKLSRKETSMLGALAGLTALDAAAAAAADQETGEAAAAPPDPLAWVRWYAGPAADACLAVAAARLGDAAARAAYTAAHAARQAGLAAAIGRAREGRTLLTAARARAGGVKPGRALGELLTAAERLAAVRGYGDGDVDAVEAAVREAGLWPPEGGGTGGTDEVRKRARG